MCILLTALAVRAVTPEEAKEFLFSTLSLPDRADYSTQFYDDNIKATFAAREEMPWGKTVPDREFLHFVVPLRVNNENLDMSRPAFYAELKDRVRGLAMKDAILEVNHWCHEKVTYRPSDGRTSSPLSTVSQAIGRCGEESTFTVAALRAVGIPARQIYTPRWAHTDDNHAWVEAWADGRWYFLGACEPEPVLDLAWFNEPASRGLLMSTNVPGYYDGPEEVLKREPLTTSINVTSKYAPTDTLAVRVTYPDGAPASGARVSFCIYNYAEYYPAVVKTAAADGTASLNAGLGDMVVWATDGSRFGFAKGRPGAERPLEVVLDKDGSWEGTFEFDIIPPKSLSSAPVVSAEMRSGNNMRFQREDSIRNAYMATFATPATAGRLASELGLDSDKLTKVLTEARGNHALLTGCLRRFDGEKRRAALDLLLAVSEKDRRDIPADVIADHVNNVVANPGVSAEIYNRYILSPRIENEFPRPWRGPLTRSLAAEGLASGDTGKLIAWIDDNIADADAENPLRLRMSPLSVMDTRKADRRSRNIFFVAAARTLGIPARIDPVTGATQYYDYGDEGWRTVLFRRDTAAGESATVKSPGQATLKLAYSPEGYVVDPMYYSQFSLSKLSGGMPRQLEYDENATVSSVFKEPVELEAGQYVLTSGQRLANGGVLARSEIFTLRPGENLVKRLSVRHDDSEVSVIGALNAENIYHDIDLDADKSILSTTGRGYYVVGLISPNHEPSAHALNDLTAVSARLEGTGVKILLMFDSAEAASRFKREAFAGLPSNVVFGIDNGGKTRSEILGSLHKVDAVNPVFVIADTFNRVVWVSTGYTIGIGEQILGILSRVK